MAKAEACKASIPSSNLGATFFFSLLPLLSSVLYLVATPIGNLKDITIRALELLQQSEYILCEDTRHSGKLLKHCDITTPLVSYHKFNEAKREEQTIEDLKAGKEICLISDAGTPGIADPGSRLVQRCIEESIQVVAIPGPCAAIAAITSSGFNTERFQFVGFLLQKSSALQQQLQSIVLYPGTTVCYESPKRILKTLQLIEEIAPDRKVSVARELTKKFEEQIQGSSKELITLFKEKPPKGEIVLLISEESNPTTPWEELSIAEHVSLIQEQSESSKKEAIKIVANIRSVPKRAIYNALIK